MSNSTDANFHLKAFETPSYFILLLDRLWHSPVMKSASVFPSGTNRTLACLVLAQDIRVCVE